MDEWNEWFTHEPLEEDFRLNDVGAAIREFLQKNNNGVVRDDHGHTPLENMHPQMKLDDQAFRDGIKNYISRGGDPNDIEQ